MLYEGVNGVYWLANYMALKINDEQSLALKFNR